MSLYESLYKSQVFTFLLLFFHAAIQFMPEYLNLFRSIRSMSDSFMIASCLIALLPLVTHIKSPSSILIQPRRTLITNDMMCSEGTISGPRISPRALITVFRICVVGPVALVVDEPPPLEPGPIELLRTILVN